jgi:hypothetical protein
VVPDEMDELEEGILASIGQFTCKIILTGKLTLSW